MFRVNSKAFLTSSLFPTAANSGGITSQLRRPLHQLHLGRREVATDRAGRRVVESSNIPAKDAIHLLSIRLYRLKRKMMLLSKKGDGSRKPETEKSKSIVTK